MSSSDRKRIKNYLRSYIQLPPSIDKKSIQTQQSNFQIRQITQARPLIKILNLLRFSVKQISLPQSSTKYFSFKLYRLATINIFLEKPLNISLLQQQIFSMRTNKQNQNSRMSKASLPEYAGQNLEEYMEIVYSHQKQWEKEGKYMEADMAKKKLTKMRTQLDKQKRQNLKTRHENQKYEVEMAHVQQIAQFNRYWDEKMIEYQQEAEKLEQQTLIRHQAEMQEFHREIEESLDFRQKQSGQVINLRKIEENLARQQSYVQAHRVQKQLQQLERIEYEKWSITRDSKIRNLLNQLRNKQENQASALRQRIEQGFDEQKKARTIEYEKLIQKYQNFLTELEKHQNQELIRFEKSVKLQSASNFSKASTMSRAMQSIQSRN